MHGADGAVHRGTEHVNYFSESQKPSSVEVMAHAMLRFDTCNLSLLQDHVSMEFSNGHET